MTYTDDLVYLTDFSYIGSLLELMLVTSCLATIIYLATKNQYISYLSCAPIYYFISMIFYQSSHFILLVIAMSVQAIVILFIQKKNLLNKLSSKEIAQDYSIK